MFIECKTPQDVARLCTIKSLLKPYAVWKSATANIDPQTDICYIHVPRRRRRRNYIMDTVFHIAVHGSEKGWRWGRGERALRSARRIIRKYTAEQEAQHGKLKTSKLKTRSIMDDIEAAENTMRHRTNTCPA